MRLRFPTLGICALFIGLLNGQDVTKVTEPEFIHQFFEIDPSGALKALESKTEEIVARSVSKSSSITSAIIGVGKTDMISFAQIAGNRSTVRFAEGSDLSFVVRMANRDVDPATLLRLYRFTVTAGNREVALQRLHKNKMKSMDQSIVLIDISKYGALSYKIKAKSPLTAGEYALTMNDVQGASCFGVDKAP